MLISRKDAHLLSKLHVRMLVLQVLFKHKDVPVVQSHCLNAMYNQKFKIYIKDSIAILQLKCQLVLMQLVLRVFLFYPHVLLVPLFTNNQHLVNAVHSKARNVMLNITVHSAKLME